MFANGDDRRVAIDAVVGDVTVRVEHQGAVPDPARRVHDDVTRAEETRCEGVASLVSGGRAPEHVRSDALDHAKDSNGRE
jgi:hypothetical protein